MRDLLLALSAGPLDIHQVAADLVAPPGALDGPLKTAIETGLVEPVVLDTGRSAWTLTRRGRDTLEDFV